MRATIALEAAAVQCWQVLVVGAGPAGALAARELATAGATVLLVDRQSFPRVKVCGACLNGRALAILNDVGLGDLVGRAGGIELRKFRVRAGGREAFVELPAGRSLSREKLDAALVESAVAAGAEFLPETMAAVEPAADGARPVRLTGRSCQMTVRARIVLVASGLAQQSLARDPNWQVVQSRTSRIGTGGVACEFPEFYEEGTIFMAVGRHGYVGLVRLEDGRLNIAAAFDREFLRSSTPAAASQHVLIEAGFPAPARLDQVHWQGTASLTRRTVPLASERLFLLGDAAGYVEPFTGEGIAWALASGQAVVPLVMEGVDGWNRSRDLAKTWTATHASLIGRRQRLCRGVARGLRHPRLVRLALTLLTRWPALARPVLNRFNAPGRPDSVGYTQSARG